MQSATRTAEKSSSSGNFEAFEQLLTIPYVYCISHRVGELEQFPFEAYDDVIDETLKAICNGNSVLLVGEPGIGKRSLSLGLARRLASLRKESGNPLYSRTVYTLSLGNYFWSGGGSNNIKEMQQNVRNVFSLVEEAGPEHIVLCIDDIDILGFVDRLVNETGEASQSKQLFSLENTLRFLLFDKKVLCLCTCIRSAYKRLIDSDTYYDEKFTKAFRVIHMKPPNASVSLQILKAHKSRIEVENNASITDEAVVSTVHCADRYLSHRAMPEKAIDVLSAACSLVRTNKCKNTEPDKSSSSTEVVVDRKDVESLIHAWCGVTVQHDAEMP
ncbi:Chaperone protein ClpB [Gracilariopsis chorda]|uniref:Chaperone protein ClpB n=1 Tax=Gracilariopsis chorda TaxID=448386 RepID=A0A2V3IEL6_9FLOR|nr:Chaperone protein ClpB [Gracilariopsis chorda]|eukprot:PXF40491.1 Chaperone protein ClpB [Gracilariopsis chorda]